jgi:phage shock protein C
MTERPPEPEEAGEPEEPTEVSEPEEPTEVTEVDEPTEVTERQPEEPEPSATAEDEPATGETVEEEPAAEPVAEPAAPAPPAEPRLARSRDDRVIAGVCGGLARYLGIDPVLVRIAALLLIFAGGVGILLYVIGWIAMPEEPDENAVADDGTAPSVDELERRRGAAILGLVFVVLGIFFLLDEVWPDLSWRYVWPVALIAVGFAIVLRGRR